jgi:predicted amidohydrolase
MQLTISVVQMDVITSDPASNLQKAEAWIAEAARRSCDVVCLPEMWTTGFNWHYNQSAASQQCHIVERVAAMAKQYRIWTAGSLLELNAQGQMVNAAILFDPDGKRAGTYHKAHLFNPLREKQYIAQGNRLTLIEAPWGRTGFAVCYDIRFPELFRTYALQGAEIIFCPSAFPHPRLEHWKVLLRARAIEDQVFMVGVNQVGSEQFNSHTTITYCGSSAIIDPWGKAVCEANETDEGILTATIDMEQVSQVRASMQVLSDRRPDLYELD